jgi:hypothetical protein
MKGSEFMEMLSKLLQFMFSQSKNHIKYQEEDWHSALLSLFVKCSIKHNNGKCETGIRNTKSI